MARLLFARYLLLVALAALATAFLWTTRQAGRRRSDQRAALDR